MKRQQLQPLTPAALYARVSSDRQDVDLSVSAQLRALKEYAMANGYSVAREYVDEAESGRVADRPQFREMIEEGSKSKAPFDVILVWKFSRFTRKREHAVAFKSQLRRKGIRVVSITEQAEDNATGRLLEGIIESVDEYYSENLAQEVVRGMREAASRGFFLGSKAPFGYRKVKISDGAKERPTLEVDPATAPVVKEIFEKSLRGSGLKELCKELNERGVTNRGKRWYKGTLHYVLTNEAYTGTAVWGRNSKGDKAQEPVRVEGAWPALVSRELFENVQQAMSDRAPKVQRPGRVGSPYLLSGLLKCGVCGRPYSAQGAKSGQFAYYICGTLFREGAGTCSARYLNAPKLETFVVEKIRERILNEETIVALVQLVAEEIDAMAGELADRLEVVEAELADVRKRLGKLYEAIETSELTLEVLSPRIMSLRHREEQLEAAREDAETQLEQRRVELPTTEEIKGYVADFREFLKEGTIPERKALIRNFVEGIEVMGDEATLTYTVPMPSDGVTSESASVLDFVKSGPPTTPILIRPHPTPPHGQPPRSPLPPNGVPFNPTPTSTPEATPTMDYEPIDISAWCGAGADILPGEDPLLGEQAMRGLPFTVGAPGGDPDGKCYVSLAAGDAPVTLPVRKNRPQPHRRPPPDGDRAARQRPRRSPCRRLLDPASTTPRPSPSPSRERYEISVVSDRQGISRFGIGQPLPRRHRPRRHPHAPLRGPLRTRRKAADRVRPGPARVVLALCVAQPHPRPRHRVHRVRPPRPALHRRRRHARTRRRAPLLPRRSPTRARHPQRHRASEKNPSTSTSPSTAASAPTPTRSLSSRPMSSCPTRTGGLRRAPEPQVRPSLRRTVRRPLRNGRGVTREARRSTA